MNGGASETLLLVGAAVAAASAGLAVIVAHRFVTPSQARVAGTIAAAAAFAATGWALAVMPTLPLFLVTAVLAWTLAVLGTIDAFTLRLPDALTLPLIAAGAADCWLLPGRPIIAHVAGAIGAYALMAGLAWAFRRFRGRDALGLGDAKLMAAAAAWLGPAALPSLVLLSCGAAIAWIFAHAAWQGRQALAQRIAFGVPLALAIWITWLYGALIPIGG
ncbi:MAG TPA: A24 family peptidase [Rhizomicrobium sp.]|nr:A24 family peptidase [Rhizomicrobium sp.]